MNPIDEINILMFSIIAQTNTLHHLKGKMVIMWKCFFTNKTFLLQL